LHCAARRWEWDPATNAEKEKCVPYQLQRLFTSLYTSEDRAGPTEMLVRLPPAPPLPAAPPPLPTLRAAVWPLSAFRRLLTWPVGGVVQTKAFGWTSSDAFAQHDVQEMFNMLSTALETTFEGTPQVRHPPTWPSSSLGPERVESPLIWHSLGVAGQPDARSVHRLAEGLRRV